MPRTKTYAVEKAPVTPQLSGNDAKKYVLFYTELQKDLCIVYGYSRLQ